MLLTIDMEPVNNFLHMVSLSGPFVWPSSPSSSFFPPLSPPSVLSPPLSPSVTSFFPPLPSSPLLSPSGHLGERALNGSGRKGAGSDPVTEPAGWDLLGPGYPSGLYRTAVPLMGSLCTALALTAAEGEQCETWRMGSAAVPAPFSSSKSITVVLTLLF